MVEIIRKIFPKIFHLNKHKIIVLVYHRIADLETDPWQLAVNPRNFDEQLQIIRKNFKVLTIDELVEQVSNNDIRENQIFITFDDAYSDNYRNAKLILEKHECPATFFVPTHFIGQQKEFWSDELEMIMLHSYKLPRTISLQINSKLFEFTLQREELTNEEWSKHRLWALPNAAPTERCKLYLKLWEQLKPLRYDKINIIMEKIRQWSGHEYKPTVDSFPMNSIQLKELAEHKLFSLGIHTHTHPALAHYSKEIQQEEIVYCKNYLEQHFNKKISSIAYPYGNYNDTSILVAKEQQIAVGFTTKKRAVLNSSSPLALGRFQAMNWDRNAFDKQLKKWF